MSQRIESALALLREAAALAPAAFSTSFGAEDMVLLDLIQRHQLAIEIFTLDTGRLPEPKLDDYYQENVIGGLGAFVIIAEDFRSFANAIMSAPIAGMARCVVPLRCA